MKRKTGISKSILGLLFLSLAATPSVDVFDSAPVGRNILTLSNVELTENYSCMALSKLGNIEATTTVFVKRTLLSTNLMVYFIVESFTNINICSPSRSSRKSSDHSSNINIRLSRMGSCSGE